MEYLEERNLVWHLLELIILKHNLKASSEYLDPRDDDDIEFGNFVKGNPMSFYQDYNECICELQRKLPRQYAITNAKIIGTGDGTIGITKIEQP